MFYCLFFSLWKKKCHVNYCKRGCKRKLPQCLHPQSTCGRPLVWLLWHWCYPYVMAFSVTRSESNWAFMGYSGMTPETAFSTSIKQVWVDWLSRARMVPYPSCRIADAAGLYATVHTGRNGRMWWPSIRSSDFTLAFPFFCSIPVWYCGTQQKREGYLTERKPQPRNAWSTRTYLAQYIFGISCYTVYRFGPIS